MARASDAEKAERLNHARNLRRSAFSASLARDAEKAERLNHARNLLRRFDHLPDAVDKMVRDCSVSHRQAYRYLQQAGRLKEDVPFADAKIAFTVKLSET